VGRSAKHFLVLFRVRFSDVVIMSGVDISLLSLRFEKGCWCIGWKFCVIGMSTFIEFIMICVLGIVGSEDLSVP
jgi:hypothetical protein